MSTAQLIIGQSSITFSTLPHYSAGFSNKLSTCGPLQLCFDSMTLYNTCRSHLVYVRWRKPVLLQHLSCVFSNSWVWGKTRLCRSLGENRGRPGAFTSAGVLDERSPFLVMWVWAHLVERQHGCNAGISPIKNLWPICLSLWSKTFCEEPSQLWPITEAHLRRQLCSAQL